MNVEKIKQVRDRIAELPAERFNMGIWAGTLRGDEYGVFPSQLNHDCGTAACIGGWAEAVAAAEREDGSIPIAEHYLDLSNDQADALFYPNVAPLGLYSMSQLKITHAVKVLDHLIETGEVDWASAIKAAQ